MNRRWGPILPGCSEIVGFPRVALPLRAPRSLIGRGQAGGGRLGKRDWGSENVTMKVVCLLYYN